VRRPEKVWAEFFIEIRPLYVWEVFRALLSGSGQWSGIGGQWSVVKSEPGCPQPDV
jgi:hypothetical protein